MLRRFPVPKYVFTPGSSASFLPSHQYVIGMFLNAVSANNLAKQLLYLRKLKTVPDPNMQNIKADCLHLVFQNLLKHSRSINVYDLQKFLAEFKVDSRAAPQMVLCLLYAYSNWIKNGPSVSRMRTLAIAAYVHDKISSLVARNRQILDTIQHDPIALETYNSIELQLAQTKTKKRVKVLPQPEPDAGVEQNLDIEKFKRNGVLSFTAMLKYISTPFEQLSVSLDQHLDSLSAEQKQRFLASYNRFSELKQKNVEQNMANTTVHVLKSTSNLAKFSLAAMQSEIANWTALVVSHLENLPAKQESAEDHILYNFYGYLQLVDLRFLSELTVNAVLAATLNAGAPSVPLVNILTNLERRFRQAAQSQTQITLPLSQTDCISIFACMVTLVLDKCLLNVDNIKQDEFMNFNEFRHPAENTYYAFKHHMVRDQTKTIGSISANPFLRYKYRAFSLIEDGDLFQFPMVCPPKPWVSPRVGGFLTDCNPLVVSKHSETYLDYLDDLAKHNQLDFIYENIDYINSHPWLINRSVLSIVKQVVESDTDFQEIPSTATIGTMASDTRIEKSRLRALRSKRDKYEQLLHMAQAYTNNMIYFSHQLDFRGRIYPAVSALSYYDEDMTRALLVFAESKPLGPTGYNWLKYHLAGVYGEDKLPMEQRLEFIDANLDKIIRSAQDPLNETWWQHGEKPWQTLALCFEMHKIQEFSKADKIENYKCRVPIHLDGSCNGLQHYAALGKDIHGGKYVNLLPSDTKRDVYAVILELVKQKLDSSQPLDALIQKFISRKVVKRPVMTFVYGVTKYGASNHINEELRDIKPRDHGLSVQEFNLMRDNPFKVGNRIAQLIFDSIDDLFTSAVRSQHWLQNNCLRVSLSIDKEELQSKVDFLDYRNFKPLMWTSSSGFPVIQMYNRVVRKSIRTPLQSVSLSTSASETGIDIRKQLNSTPANFIHSLDAVHMLLTCYSCKQASIPFVAVHDSFWTLPCHGEELGRRLRSEFIHLHSQDIVGNLYQDLIESTKDAYQLVFVENAANPRLVNAISEARKKYEFPRQRDRMNKILQSEAKDSEALAFYEALIDAHKPELYLKRRAKLISLNDFAKKLTFKASNYTPIIMRVVIEPPPPAGDLDINEVAHSQFFFS